MHKFFLIALKDLKLSFRDRTALMLMLLAPFALTLGMGAVTGRFSGGYQHRTLRYPRDHRQPGRRRTCHRNGRHVHFP